MFLGIFKFLVQNIIGNEVEIIVVSCLRLNKGRYIGRELCSLDRDRIRDYKREIYYVLGWIRGETIWMDFVDTSRLFLLGIILFIFGICLYGQNYFKVRSKQGLKQLNVEVYDNLIEVCSMIQIRVSRKISWEIIGIIQAWRMSIFFVVYVCREIYLSFVLICSSCFLFRLRNDYFLFFFFKSCLCFFCFVSFRVLFYLIVFISYYILFFRSKQVINKRNV